MLRPSIPALSLSDPVIIGPTLEPSVKVGNVFVSVWPSGKGRDKHGRTFYRWTISGEHNGKRIEATGDELSPPLTRQTFAEEVRAALSTLLSFLAYFADARDARWGEPDPEGDGFGAFPAGLAEWAVANRDEFSMLECDFEDNPNCISEA